MKGYKLRGVGFTGFCLSRCHNLMNRSLVPHLLQAKYTEYAKYIHVYIYVNKNTTMSSQILEEKNNWPHQRLGLYHSVMLPTTTIFQCRMLWTALQYRLTYHMLFGDFWKESSTRPLKSYFTDTDKEDRNTTM